VDTRILYDWVVMLQRDHGITVTKASLSANDGAATVRVQLQLAGKVASGA
jgi:type II secretory pathway component PulM